MRNTKAYSAFNATSPLAPFTFQCRDPGADEVEIQILFCGVCHTDLHISRATNGTARLIPACPAMKSSGA